MTILIIFLIVLCISICYSKFVMKDNLIKIFGMAFLIVETGSMEPTIESGELLVISDKVSYGKNDIVTFYDSDGFLVTHRIININEKDMLTKGDGNNVYDERTDISRIEGKVILHSKILGFFVIYLLKPIILIQMFIFIIFNIYSICNKKKEDSHEKVENSENN